MNSLACRLVFLAITLSAGASEPKDLSKTLEAFLQNSQTPGIAAAVIVDGEIAAGAAGIRKQGAPDKVQPNDKFHLGSNTKSMTATLAAILVQDGIIRWDTTIGETFSDLDIHPKYESVQLHQLLTNTGGAPFQPGEKLWNAAWSAKGTPPEQRLSMVKGILKKAPAYEPGKGYL